MKGKREEVEGEVGRCWERGNAGWLSLLWRGEMLGWLLEVSGGGWSDWGSQSPEEVARGGSQGPPERGLEVWVLLAGALSSPGVAQSAPHLLGSCLGWDTRSGVPTQPPEL